MTIAVTRRELSAADLRREAVRCREAAASRRMLALASVLEGGSREAAARAAGMDRQTLRDRVHRYNAEGLRGLRDRPRSGRKPRLTPEQGAELATVVDRGPDPDRDGVVRWRRVDLKALIEARFGVTLHERSVGKLLRRLGFARLSVRPQHPLSDPEAQDAFKKPSPGWCARPCPSAHAASRSRSGSRTRRGSGSRARWPGSGPAAAAGPEPRATAATPGRTCPARSAPSAPSVPGSSCPTPTSRPWACTSPRSAARSPPAPTPWSCSTGRDGTAPRPSELPGTSPSCRPLPRHSPELNPVESVWEYLRQNYLGLPACLARLRRHRRDLLHRLECPHAGAGPDRLYHPPRLG
jgi:transposase